VVSSAIKSVKMRVVAVGFMVMPAMKVDSVARSPGRNRRRD